MTKPHPEFDICYAELQVIQPALRKRTRKSPLWERAKQHVVLHASPCRERSSNGCQWSGRMDQRRLGSACASTFTGARRHFSFKDFAVAQRGTRGRSFSLTLASPAASHAGRFPTSTSRTKTTSRRSACWRCCRPRCRAGGTGSASPHPRSRPSLLFSRSPGPARSRRVPQEVRPYARKAFTAGGQHGRVAQALVRTHPGRPLHVFFAGSFVLGGA